MNGLFCFIVTLFTLQYMIVYTKVTPKKNINATLLLKSMIEDSLCAYKRLITQVWHMLIKQYYCTGVLWVGHNKKATLKCNVLLHHITMLQIL